jgi:hypothetical protein
MRWRHVIWSLVVVASSFSAARAQTYSLSEASLPKSCYRVQLTMELAGKIRFQQEGKPVTLEQKASARHAFLERIIDAKDGVAEKSVRLYQSAEASIVVEKETLKRSLRPERSFMIAQRGKNQAATYCPKGLLTQEEMELTEHLDTLNVPGLLPGKEVAVGDTWSISGGAVIALCDLDGLINQNLSAKLEEVKGDIAHARLLGKVQGIDMGAQVTMLVEAKFEFDLKEKRITSLTWKQTDERMQGPVNPALAAEVVYKMTRTPILEPAELNEIALVPLLAVPADKMTPLHYRDAKARFEIQHGREWHLVGQEDKHVVFRLMDRGDFVAQATLTPFKKEQPGMMMPIDDFVNLMAAAPGWEHEELLEKNDKVDVAGASGLKVYRVGASGKLEGVKAVQYFYLIQSAQGSQMIVTFTMDPAQAQKLDARDLTLVRSLTLLEGEEAVSTK